MGRPRWNFSIPYKLKQLIDLTAQRNYLFTYDGTEYGPCLKIPKALVVYTRGSEFARILQYPPRDAPGHVYREKVYRWRDQVLEAGTWIDGCDEILARDSKGAEKWDFILVFERGKAWTIAIWSDESRPKLFIEARDETKNGPGPLLFN